jgi:hypothetical protein
MFIRPCRSATIRTRLDAAEIRERLSSLAAEPPPEGGSAFFAHGYVLGGSVGARDFHLDYKFNSAKNPQTYSVHGAVEETRDWRILRLKLTAHAPWFSKWELGGLVLFLAFSLYTREIPPAGAASLALFVMALYAGANLFYIPDVVTNRVSSLVAAQVRGSVRQGRQWIVPGT